MTRREVPLDASVILRALSDHEVDYVVIGGLAVQTHGHSRTTQDLDLVPEPSPENLARLKAALSDLGARPVGSSESTTVEIPSRGVVELDTRAGGIDVHLDPPGAAPYYELRSRALELQLEAPVLVAGRDDLISMKRASGRPIDRSDILALTEPVE
jgi:hypothetical protein